MSKSKIISSHEADLSNHSSQYPNGKRPPPKSNKTSSASSASASSQSNTHQLLPPMLSPTLPPWIDEILPKEMLSPTLPPVFNDVPEDMKESKEKHLPPRATKTRSPIPKNANTITNNNNVKQRSSAASTTDFDRNYATSDSDIEIVETDVRSKKNNQRANSNLDSAKSSPRIQVGGDADRGKMGVKDSSSSFQYKDNSASRTPSTNDNDNNKNVASNTTKRKPGESEATASTAKKKKVASESHSKEAASGQNGADPTAPQNTAVSEQREQYYRLLRTKMHKWINLAREQKHAADRAVQESDLNLAATLNMDSVICFVVGFDYEDRADSMLKKDPTPNSWATLVQHITRLVVMFEENKFSALAGVCCQIRALIHMRMINCYRKVIKHRIKTLSSNDIEKDLGGGQKNDKISSAASSDIQSQTLKLIAAQESSSADFMRGLELLDMDTLRTDFPNAWKRRTKSPHPVSKREGGYRPMENEYYLPLHMFSSLQEAAAFGYSIAKEWADNNDITIEWALERGLK